MYTTKKAVNAPSQGTANASGTQLGGGIAPPSDSFQYKRSVQEEEEYNALLDVLKEKRGFEDMYAEFGLPSPGRFRRTYDGEVKPDYIIKGF